jgi:hypothetical protein
MSLLQYPALLAFIVVIALLLIASFFIKKGEWILVSIAVIITALYLINSLLLGFNYLEIIITLLSIAILMLLILLIKGRNRQ